MTGPILASSLCKGGGADDTTALSACLNSGQPVFLDGVYRITAPIVVKLNDASGPFGFCLDGAGSQRSGIELASPSASITINASYNGNGGLQNAQINMSRFSLMPVAPLTGPALSVIGAPEVGVSASTYNIQNVHILPDGGLAPVGFSLINMRGGAMRDCRVNGAGRTKGQTAFSFGSTDNGAAGNAPCDVLFSGCHAVDCTVGVGLTPSGNTNHAYSNDWQGVHIDHCTLIGCGYSISAQSSDQNANGLVVTNNVTGFAYAGLYAMGVQGMQVVGNYFEFLAENGFGAVIGAGPCAVEVLATIGLNNFYAAPFKACHAVTTLPQGSAIIRATGGLNTSVQYGGGPLPYAGLVILGNQ